MHLRNNVTAIPYQLKVYTERFLSAGILKLLDPREIILDPREFILDPLVLAFVSI